MREWVCVNGTLLSADDAQISVFDSGFMQGIGLFETMRAYRGNVFRLEHHLGRLQASAAALGWAEVPDSESLEDAVRQVVGACEQADVRVRLTVTTGSLRILEDEPARLTVVASASAGGRYPDEMYLKGVTAVLSRYRQHRNDPVVGHKTTSYFSRLASLREAHAVGALEALWFTTEEFLAEGAISNVFLVVNEEVLTPPRDTPILPGIARACVLELAQSEGIEALEANLTQQDLLDADEVFLTNSLMEIMPVVRIGRQPIADEKPGEITRQLGAAYKDAIKRECGDEAIG